MVKAIYPGSFDPVTFGHMDIIKRASMIFDEVVVSVLINKGKSPLFSTSERVNILKELTKDMPNVSVDSFEGLLIDHARNSEANVVIRGLRAVTDFEYELQLAQTNRKLCDQVDTVFLTTSLDYAYLSSSTVKEVASFGGDITKFVPPLVADLTYQKFNKGE